ncbi:MULTISPECIES: alpha/beta fold hydrolase [unclassified Tenacibaculum]|uniref:alpha/beta fold hydrolase n=1 Tax=unclassified Tenacibaculum TaxID=2635139 RepID=UPI001F23DD0B|nr:MULTISPECIES: alpha/beta fold hydrolase [unclassified Tenacibaculum]MCF2874901.1 alpha/beta hydrolase [Tenacibaculum sp. Cn5-1]MCF2934033.1 alpha/beta hydrolase [Tenacibaculum sp. Cn5-34]MCG7510243.1 alpha/beta hydrolase [Tenacibaculum sp. Cn5-46]
MQKVYFISGTMCTVDLWQFVFPNVENIVPIHIDISNANSFEDINSIILSKIETETPVTIVGFSLGGFSALNFAIHFPNKIKKLIIVAANTNGLNDKEISLRKSTIDFLEKHSYKGISQARIQQFLHPDNHSNPKITGIIKKMDSDLGKKVLIQQLKATSSRVDISQQITQLNIPILFISAENDTLVPSEAIKKTANNTLKGKFISIKNCGHMIPLEKPKELSGILNVVLKD